MDLIAVVFAGFAAPFVLEAIRKGFEAELFTPIMPAPQAQLVAGSISGFEYPNVFITGFAIAFVGEIVNSLLRDKYKNRVMLMPMGIGLFLGLALAIPLAIGSLIRAYIDRNYRHLYHSGILVAAGVMGGEGIAGFGFGALRTAGVGDEGGLLLLGVFGVVLMIALSSLYRIKKYHNVKTS